MILEGEDMSFPSFLHLNMIADSLATKMDHKDADHTLAMVEPWTGKRLGSFPYDVMELLCILYCPPPAFIHIREINFHPSGHMQPN